MQKDGARAEMNPVITWVIIGIVVLGVVLLGFRFLGGSGGEFQKGGSEEYMKKVEQGGKLYEPPAAAFPPGAGPNRGATGSAPNQ